MCRAGTEGNGIGGIVIGISQKSGGGGGIYKIYASITWAKTNPTTDPQASINGDIGWMVSTAYVNVEISRKGV